MVKKRNIILLFLLLLTCYLSGCGQQTQHSKNKKLKIYVLTDLEGAAGVVTFQNHSYSTGKFFEKSKILFTKELNAAVEGALEAGATK